VQPLKVALQPQPEHPHASTGKGTYALNPDGKRCSLDSAKGLRHRINPPFGHISQELEGDMNQIRPDQAQALRRDATVQQPYLLAKG
jgi:hypothetical protein